MSYTTAYLWRFPHACSPYADVEHLFRVAKGEVGLSHFEGRSYVGLMRHMILCQLVLLFLGEQARRINAEIAAAAPHPATSSRGKKPPQQIPAPRRSRKPGVQLQFTVPVRPHATMEQIAASLYWLCARWIERRHWHRTGRNALERESFTRIHHQERNLAATRSRLRRYCQNEGSL